MAAAARRIREHRTSRFRRMYHQKEAAKVVTRKLLFGALCAVVVLTATRAEAQIYFQDDFEDPAASAEKWADLWGT